MLAKVSVKNFISIGLVFFRRRHIDIQDGEGLLTVGLSAITALKTQYLRKKINYLLHLWYVRVLRVCFVTQSYNFFKTI